MDELKKLVKLVADNIEKGYMLINLQDGDSKETELYNLVREGKVSSDTEANSYLYKQSHITPSYRMLKSRLRKKLLANIMFLELHPDYSRAAHIKRTECLTLLCQAEKLWSIGEYVLADKILSQVLLIARATQLTDITVRAQEMRYNIYSLRSSSKKFYQSKEELNCHIKLLSLENEAVQLYTDIRFEMGQSVKIKNSLAALLDSSVSKLRATWIQTKLPKIYNYYHLLYIAKLEMTGTFEGIIEAVRNAEDLLLQGVLNEEWYNRRFNSYIKVYALLRVKAYQEGLSAAKISLDLFSEGAHNWFALLENYVLLALHNRDYKLAQQLIRQAINHSSFENLSDIAKETWELYRLYFNLVAEGVCLEKVDSKKSVPSFVHVSKDKEGLNFNLIILDAIQYLKDPYGNADFPELHVDRIRKYSSKYLKGAIHERPRVFLKMLMVSLKGDFAYDLLVDKTRELYLKLLHTPAPSDAYSEIEIVLYEHLWEHILQILNSRYQ